MGHASLLMLHMWIVKKYFGSRKLSLVGRRLYLHPPRAKPRDVNSLSFMRRETRASGASLKAARISVRDEERRREMCPTFSPEASETLRREFLHGSSPADSFNAHCPLASVSFPLVLRRKTERRRYRTNVMRRSEKTRDVSANASEVGFAGVRACSLSKVPSGR